MNEFIIAKRMKFLGLIHDNLLDNRLAIQIILVYKIDLQKNNA